MINTLLIGCGYHARRIYVPHLMEQRKISLSAIIDLTSQKEIIEEYLNQKSISGVELYYTDNICISDILDEKTEKHLDELIDRLQISAVIISTEPLAHFKYAKWALSRKLNILLDKPITTEFNVSTDREKAKKIYSDYKSLKESYLQLLKTDNKSFILQAQRRHHMGFRKTRELIIEISKRTNCPVTSIQAFHSDGQWRFPKEIIEQTYHPYNQGYGKMSHSGYHSLDVAIWFSQSSILSKHKDYDNYEVYSQVTRPSDFFAQFTPEDYIRIFPVISKKELFTSYDLDYLNLNKGFSVTGELDAHTLIALKHGEKTITNIGSHALHNGFSQRNWISAAGRDLYKGNGRVRHESYTIEQGPFQCLIVNSFQSQEKNKDGKTPGDIGGEFHFDIHVFRNSTLFPDLKAYELITINDLQPISDLKYSQGHQEDARRNCMEEFVSAIINKTPVSDQNSNILDHELSTQLLSATYESIAANPDDRVINGKIRLKN